MKKIIYFENLQILQSIGIHEHEKATAQPYRLDIELHLGGTYFISDDKIESAVDYDVLRDRIKSHLGSRHFNLQETVVQDVMQICFGADARIIGVMVRAAKTKIYSDCAAVGLEYFSRRDEMGVMNNGASL